MNKLQNAINQNQVNSSVLIESATPFLTAVGSGALGSITSGTNNTAVGYNAGNAITSGSNSTALGYEALSKLATNSRGTAVGVNALTLTVGNDNTAVGYNAGSATTASTGNVFIGSNCGTGVTTASHQVAVGFGALEGALSGSGNQGNVAIGYEALNSTTAGLNTALGANALDILTTGSSNVGVGFNAGSSYSSSESSNIVISNTGTAAESNVIRIGTQGTGAGQQNVAYIVGPLNISGAITTQPTNSSTATTAFGSSLTAGTTVQNTTGYDLLINISVNITAAVGATVVLGVGATSPPTTNAVTSSFSTALVSSFCAIVPNNYYLLVNTTGTVTVGSITAQACPL
jgi:hypothetical protein